MILERIPNNRNTHFSLNISSLLAYNACSPICILASSSLYCAISHTITLGQTGCAAQAIFRISLYASEQQRDKGRKAAGSEQRCVIGLPTRVPDPPVLTGSAYTPKHTIVSILHNMWVSANTCGEQQSRGPLDGSVRCKFPP